MELAKITEVPHGATMWHMGLAESVNQRDLRTRSREIMDAVEHGESFIVLRDGRAIGELIPARSPKRFVTRDEFARASATMPAIVPNRFKADIDAVLDGGLSDPFERAVR